jgi:hypothetical protein
MADRALDFEDFFGEQPLVEENVQTPGNAHFEMEANVLQSILQIVELLERSAGSEAVIRLAAMGLRRALGNVVCVPEGEAVS